MKQLLAIVASIGLAGLLGACGGGMPAASAPSPTLAHPASTASAAERTETDAGVPIGPTDPTWGSRTAPVTIVEFADFQCPYCAHAEPTLARIRETYGPERVRIVWKNSPLPFHANARGAAEAAAGVHALAGDDAFWRFGAMAFEHLDSLAEDSYVAWAERAGVRDAASFRAGLKSHAWAAKVDDDLAEARAVGALGTPWFFVNGIRLTGAQPFESFQVLVDAQAIAAKAKIAAGTPPEKVYAVLSRENRSAQPADTQEEEEDAKTVFRVPVGTSPSRGPAGALVTVVEFADYECPFCVRAESTLRDLRAAYGDKMRFVFRNEPLPFHERAEPAAEAALEVRAEKGDAAFWSMHDSLLEEPRDLSDDGLVRLAVEAGARADAVKVAIAKRSHKAEIAADEGDADDFQANGTPHFFINGRRLVGAQPKARFVAILDEEIAKAQALVDAGTKPEALYDALTRDGQGRPEPEHVAIDVLPTGDPARGPTAAKVTVHEFADFQCPFCVRAEATLTEVAKAYGDRVRVVWHDLPLPFHDDAMPAARAAREARKQRGDAGFWVFHDRIFGEVPGHDSKNSPVGRAQLDMYAQGMGLDLIQWRAALDGDAHRTEVDRDVAAATKLGFGGTPSFVIVAAGAKLGYVIEGAQGFPKFRRLIERALREARP